MSSNNNTTTTGASAASSSTTVDSNAPQQQQQLLVPNTTSIDSNGTILLNDFTTPIFQSIDPNFDPQQHNNVDLDDLFRECYFMDFPVPSSFTEDGTAAVTATDAADVVSALVGDNEQQQVAGDVSVASDLASGGVAPHEEAAAGSVPRVVASATATTTIPTTSTRTATAATAATPLAVVSSHDAAAVSSSSSASNNLKRSAEDMATSHDMGSGEEVLTEQQRLERRERNREHAKRSRLRKKFLLESLQEQIQGLQEQIEAFKDVLMRELPSPEQAQAYIQKICGDKTKYTPLPMPSGFGPVKTLMEPDFRLMSALSGSQQNFAISDPSLPDNPIVYVSQGFLELTGYTLDQVLGRNCRFLQGPGTDQSAVEVIRKGINEGVDTSVCLLNYKADGTPFWNQFFVAALRDAENNVVNFVGVQCEVSKAVVEKHLGEKAAAAAAGTTTTTTSI